MPPKTKNVIASLLMVNHIKLTSCSDCLWVSVASWPLREDIIRLEHHHHSLSIALLFTTTLLLYHILTTKARGDKWSGFFRCHQLVFSLSSGVTYHTLSDADCYLRVWHDRVVTLLCILFMKRNHLTNTWCEYLDLVIYHLNLTVTRYITLTTVNFWLPFLLCVQSSNTELLHCLLK